MMMVSILTNRGRLDPILPPVVVRAQETDSVSVHGATSLGDRFRVCIGSYGSERRTDKRS
jgi:hypothetical protein